MNINDWTGCSKNTAFPETWKMGTWQHTFLYIYIYMGTSQNTRYCMDQGPGPTHDPYPPIHTLIHAPCMIHNYPWSIPLIHTLDPYPFLDEERLILALMLLFILILLLVFVLYCYSRCYSRCCSRCYSRCYYRCYYRCFYCLRCLRSLPPLPPLPPCCCCCCHY